MSSAEKLKKYSEAEYLDLERRAKEKSEFYKGEIFAMAGATHSHNIITVNLIVLLSAKLTGKGCRPYGSDMRLYISGQQYYTYPDVMVVCGTPELLGDHFDTIVNPTFICEVLSPSTSFYDSENKFTFYRSIPSLHEYWTVSSFEYRLQKFLRQRDNSWLLTETVNSTDEITLSCFDTTLAMNDIYKDVRL
ncbi:MAG: Uma2 family endonuclease [Cyclobacteriaceae bacterium]|nr:Uma2 family endonuclease [Cyclobacteriaceae bacterium]